MRGWTPVAKLGRSLVPAVIALCAAVLLLDRLFPPPINQVRTSTIVTDRDGRWLHGFTVEEGDGERRWRLSADLDDIDPKFVERLVAVEDKRFWSHIGIDFLAALRATGSLLREGEVVSGASTITMQTARLMEPRPRTIPSKLLEMIRAVQIEARLSKQEILELYLTLAPYGGNLQGLRAASLTYFGKEPSELTDAQQALLIALPQAPEARRPDRHPEAAATSRRIILAKLYAAGMLSERQRSEADEAALPVTRQQFQRLAWHVSLENSSRAANGGEVQVTLDATLQEIVERLVEQAADTLEDDANIAVLVVDNQSREVLASAGSARLSLPGGWIDMTRAERSPGSTLKPFIYGLAFDDGYAAGDTLVDDAPYSFDGYRPENFTRVFHGDVTISEALQHSLNVPAVLALDRIGPKRFAATLVASGINASVPHAADNKASLAIALGGLGMTPRDLATLYAGLASGGEISPLKWVPEEGDGSTPTSFRFMSQESARRITEIMQAAPAPAGRSPASLSVNAPKVAFKTGTSYGYRDAWSAGYTEYHTVVVWVGHPNGTPRPGVTGRTAALPLLFDVFDRMQEFQPHHPGQAEDVSGDEFSVGGALARLSPQKQGLPPEIVFPENGVTIYYSEAARERGFALSARGGAGAYQWYVDGAALDDDIANGRAIWFPSNAGFYEVTVIDAKGLRSTSSVRVLSAG